MLEVIMAPDETLGDPEALSAADRIDALVAIQRRVSWLAAAEARLLATMVDDVEARESLHDPSGRCWLAEEIGCALRLAAATVDGRLSDATALVRRLPQTLDALERGDITRMHASVLADAIAGLDDVQTAAVEATALPRAFEQNVGAFRRTAARAVAAVAPQTIEARHESAMAERRVVATPRPDGCGELWALLPADGLATVMAAVNALAGPAAPPGDGRSIDQRRADALVDIAARSLHGTRTGAGNRPVVHITVGLATLLGDNEAPGDLEGFGPVPASLARRIAADPTGTWRRIITDPAGHPLPYATTRYRPPADLARHVIRRDQSCVHPACNRRAADCDLDHRVPHSLGATSSENLQPLCRRHHRLKHRSRWRVDKPDSRTYRWTTPTGHTYDYRPPPLPRPAEPDPPPF